MQNWAVINGYSSDSQAPFISQEDGSIFFPWIQGWGLDFQQPGLWRAENFTLKSASGFNTSLPKTVKWRSSMASLLLLPEESPATFPLSMVSVLGQSPTVRIPDIFSISSIVTLPDLQFSSQV